MFSRIVAIVFAVSCIFVVNTSVIKAAKMRVLEPVLACSQTANSAAMAYEKAMEGHRDTDADDIKLSCLSTEVYDECLAAIIKATPVPVPRVWYIFATLGYQTSVLLKRANLCPEKTIEKLKKITEGSGIMKEEGLSNIENDPYVKCAGDALKKCLVEDVALSEHHEDTETEDYAYVKCMKKQVETCTADIMRHFVEQLVKFEGLAE